MVRSYLAVAGVTVASLGLSMVTNCGGSTTNATGSGGSVPAVHAEPPAPPPTMPGDGATSVTFAISKLYLGDTDFDGTPDLANGWKQFGYDLDGKISTATSTDLCQAARQRQPQERLPRRQRRHRQLVRQADPADRPRHLEHRLDGRSTQSITGGKFTIMLDMLKLGTGTNYNPLTTNLYAGGDLGMAPKFDGTDQWPVLSTLLNNPTSLDGGSKVSFASSYVTNNTWVSGSKGNVTLALTISGFTLSLVIANAVITLNLNAGHTGGTQGIIAGVLATDQLTTQLQQVAGSFDPTLCSGPTIESILSQITQASDILADGTQDPTQPCTGISIGLGFDAEVVQLGPIMAPAAPKPNPCGTGGGGGGSAVDGG